MKWLEHAYHHVIVFFGPRTLQSFDLAKLHHLQAWEVANHNEGWDGIDDDRWLVTTTTISNTIIQVEVASSWLNW